MRFQQARLLVGGDELVVVKDPSTADGDPSSEPCRARGGMAATCLPEQRSRAARHLILLR
jgi:hypothetical protein